MRITVCAPPTTTVWYHRSRRLVVHYSICLEVKTQIDAFVLGYTQREAEKNEKANERANEQTACVSSWRMESGQRRVGNDNSLYKYHHHHIQYKFSNKQTSIGRARIHYFAEQPKTNAAFGSCTESFYSHTRSQLAKNGKATHTHTHTRTSMHTHKRSTFTHASILCTLYVAKYTQAVLQILIRASV